MADRVRCTDCRHCPGLGERCAFRPEVHASRHPRRCAHFQQITTITIHCGDYRHRSPTAVCYYWSSIDKELVRVPADLECIDCEGFEVRRRWAC